MKIVMINGSPRAKDSNSECFAKALAKRLDGENIINCSVSTTKLSQEQISEISTCDVLVFCFPLYVDGIPAHLLYVLKELEKMNFETRPMVYAVVNCGFFEGEHTRLTFEMLEHWCMRTELTWGQGLGIGGGEMLGSLKNVAEGAGPKKTLGVKLCILAESIKKLASGDAQYASPNFPRFLFVLFASQGWKSMAKANGLRPKDLLRVPS